ncbi:DUF1986 domain-containing protein [Myxococcus sp. RHSTA-1-4]|uniref:DUF1986 domain-containing protein n=1 Tax=Myxococcus sp. RHSTA-1-4 TaxID=2874601 RepID=UPI001CBE9D22|nr:DUF1986 domain-containing protein [Myxococcus sp. RHSTA-1-4]MBZ4419774.1 DUF1986 domain-containing protein [Myxococcus sp. RHSTA-1-4]
MKTESVEASRSRLSSGGVLLCLALVVPQAGCLSSEVEEVAVEPTASMASEIIGGTVADVGEYPWQAQLSVPGYSHYCGGSLIDSDWVLTAAHCVEGLSAGSFTVRLGLHQRSAPDSYVQTRGVRRVVRHPSYNSWTLENDVALLELSTPVTYTPRVQPIALRETDAAVGATARVSGWGNTSPGSGASDLLMETLLPVQDTATCNSAGTLPATVRDSMVCAGYLNGTSGGCHGDSGGPLVVESGRFSGGWEQIGIVSWGVGGSCSSYTVFARVSRFVQWIRGYTGPVSVFGDVNADGCVNDTDLNQVTAAYGQTVPPADPALDLTRDGVINIQDRLIVLQNYGQGCP